MNDSFTKYYSRVSFQRTGQELIDGLKVCVSAALKQFFALNQSLPNLIIVFRDGVGDGMLSAVVRRIFIWLSKRGSCSQFFFLSKKKTKGGSRNSSNQRNLFSLETLSTIVDFHRCQKKNSHKIIFDYFSKGPPKSSSWDFS